MVGGECWHLIKLWGFPEGVPLVIIHFRGSINGGTPKSSILMGFSMGFFLTKTIHFGVPWLLKQPLPIACICSCEIKVRPRSLGALRWRWEAREAMNRSSPGWNYQLYIIWHFQIGLWWNLQYGELELLDISLKSNFESGIDIIWHSKIRNPKEESREEVSQPIWS